MSDSYYPEANIHVMIMVNGIYYRGIYVTIDKGRNSQINKQHNRGLVLKLIATGQCRIRAELARQTGLTKMAVTNIVSELIDLNLLVESVVEPDDLLRKNAIVLQISPEAPKIALPLSSNPSVNKIFQTDISNSFDCDDF